MAICIAALKALTSSPESTAVFKAASALAPTVSGNAKSGFPNVFCITLLFLPYTFETLARDAEASAATTPIMIKNKKADIWPTFLKIQLYVICTNNLLTFFSYASSRSSSV